MQIAKKPMPEYATTCHNTVIYTNPLNIFFHLSTTPLIFIHHFPSLFSINLPSFIFTWNTCKLMILLPQTCSFLFSIYFSSHSILHQLKFSYLLSVPATCNSVHLVLIAAVLIPLAIHFSPIMVTTCSLKPHYFCLPSDYIILYSSSASDPLMTTARKYLHLYWSTFLDQTVMHLFDE